MKQSRFLLENGAEVFGCGGLCFVGLLAPRSRQHGMLHPTWCSFEQKGFAGLQGVWFGYGGLAPPPCPRVNAGCLIPNDALSGIKKVQKTLKNSVECLGSWRKDF